MSVTTPLRKELFPLSSYDVRSNLKDEKRSDNKSGPFDYNKSATQQEHDKVFVTSTVSAGGKHHQTR
jgi:hypothetical protein